MADKEFVPGQEKTQVQWITAGGTVELYVDSRAFTYTPSIEMVDRTAGWDTSRKRVPSFKDGQASCEYTAQSDGTALLSALKEGTPGTLIWGPSGTATGRPKRSMPAYSLGVTETYPFSDVAMWTLSWQQDGDRTDGAW